jgi:hypothetical protein
MIKPAQARDPPFFAARARARAGFHAGAQAGAPGRGPPRAWAAAERPPGAGRLRRAKSWARGGGGSGARRGRIRLGNGGPALRRRARPLRAARGIAPEGAAASAPPNIAATFPAHAKHLG